MITGKIQNFCESLSKKTIICHRHSFWENGYEAIMRSYLMRRFRYDLGVSAADDIFLVLTAALVIVGYNLFLWVKILSPLVLDSYFCRHKNQTKYCPLLNALHLIY